jgi:hypothetical protein
VRKLPVIGMSDWLLIYKDTLVELSVKDAYDELEIVVVKKFLDLICKASFGKLFKIVVELFLDRCHSCSRMRFQSTSELTWWEFPDDFRADQA